jgi:hypothetical protein
MTHGQFWPVSTNYNLLPKYRGHRPIKAAFS